VHASDDDAWLARTLVSAGKHGMPAAVSQVCQVHIQNDHGMRAVYAICQRVFQSTEDAATALKRAVRQPNPVKARHKVAVALAQWDSDRVEAVARGYSFDQHDFRAALYGLVVELREFDSVVQALKRSVPGGHPSVEAVREALGELASDFERRPPPTKASTTSKSKSARKRAAKAKAKAKAANVTAPSAGFSKTEVKDMMSAMVAEVTKINVPCREWAAGGSCRFGDRCKFLHANGAHARAAHAQSTNRFVVLAAPESKPKAGSRDKFMAMMAEIFDGATAPKVFAERV
jgi:hypothetical protein